MVESMGDMMKEISKGLNLNSKCFKKRTDKEIAEFRLKSMNESKGDMDEADGYHCEICNDKGVVFYIEEITRGEKVDYRERSRECKCIKIRRSLRHLKKSGLEDAIKKCSFDRYDAVEPWQIQLKTAAMRFAKDDPERVNNWWFVGGANGAGKSHLCTAIAADFLRRGKSVIYMRWVDDSTTLKACANDAARYEDLIRPMKTADVLYIDDFFKITKDPRTGEAGLPTAADVKVAYEVLNYRYNNHHLVTIISSERYITELIDIDPATGSRICEKTEEQADKPESIAYMFNIKREVNKNYRLRNVTLL